MRINQYIDHTNLKPTASSRDIEKLCREAIEHQFFAVCVNGSNVQLAAKFLDKEKVKIATVVGFPLGAMSAESKVAEAQNCLNDGADEIDMVINIGQLKEGNVSAVTNEILQIKNTIGQQTLKVIIETCYLTNDEIVAACRCAVQGNADFVKTSTGFGTNGAKVEDVKLMAQTVEGHLKIKASGGIRDYYTALQYIELGVSRIGTSSGIGIVEESKTA